MITNVEISNYRSIGDKVSLKLGSLTALVGPNGSGKSNVVDALRFVAEALRNGLEAAVTKRHGFAAIRRWSAGRPFDVTIRIDIAGENGHEGTYVIELGAAKAEEHRVKREFARHRFETVQEAYISDDGVSLPSRREAINVSYEIVDGKWKSGPKHLRPEVDQASLVLPIIAADFLFRGLADILRRISIYTIFPDTLREPQKPDPTTPMNEHGANWCSVLKRLKHEDWGPDLKAALGEITGDIDDVRVRQVGGYLVTEFRHGVSTTPGGKTRPRWFEAAQESDGTLRMAGIITALLQEPPLTLIGIEEPELTIHPGALPLLYDYLKEASTRSQVIITTHSPELLSLLNADEVRVVERHDGVTTVSPMEESQREAVKERLLTLGDLMRMEGLRPEPQVQPSGTGG
jgi:predicted ATPase